MQKNLLLVMFLSFALIGACAHAQVVNNVDLEQVEAELKSEGVIGHVHGAVHEYGHYVFTYRDKNNFFNHLEFSMVAMSSQAKSVFATLRRHDKVKLQGKFSSKNPSAFKHIYVQNIEVVKKYEGPVSTPDYRHTLNLPQELEGKESFVGKIHAIVYDSNVLVAEYKDTVLPLYSEKPEMFQHLFREDTVEIFYKVIPARGPRPMHLEVDLSKPEPIRMLAPIAEGHDTPVTLSGELVMFPQSPQILFNVFAIRVVDQFGVSRNYTLVNFDDAELFKKLREKLQKLWDDASHTAIGTRNAWINPKLVLTVSGTKNVVSPVQANPQILIDNLDDVVVKYVR